MKLVAVENVPKRKHPYHKLQRMIKDFVNGDSQVVKIELGDNEYKNFQSFYSALYKAVKRSGYFLKVYLRGSDVYLSKKIETD